MSISECIFCQLIGGEAPGTFVYQDDVVVAFLDINSVTPGHLMVVPRAHLPALADIDDQTGAHMFNVAQKMAAALLSSGLRGEGINLFYADGEAAGQEILHAHLHVFPRFKGDGFRIDADWDSGPTRDELDQIGSQIRAVLDR